MSFRTKLPVLHRVSVACVPLHGRSVVGVSALVAVVGSTLVGWDPSGLSPAGPAQHSVSRSSVVELCSMGEAALSSMGRAAEFPVVCTVTELRGNRPGWEQRAPLPREGLRPPLARPGDRFLAVADGSRTWSRSRLESWSVLSGGYVQQELEEGRIARFRSGRGLSVGRDVSRRRSAERAVTRRNADPSERDSSACAASGGAASGFAASVRVSSESSAVLVAAGRAATGLYAASPSLSSGAGFIPPPVSTLLV